MTAGRQSVRNFDLRGRVTSVRGSVVDVSFPAGALPDAGEAIVTPGTADRLAKELYARIAAGEAGRVEVMFSRYRQGARPAIERRQLLPLDTAIFARGLAQQAPLHNIEPGALFEKLAAEYVFALLIEAAVEFSQAKTRRASRPCKPRSTTSRKSSSNCKAKRDRRGRRG